MNKHFASLVMKLWTKINWKPAAITHSVINWLSNCSTMLIPHICDSLFHRGILRLTSGKSYVIPWWPFTVRPVLSAGGSGKWFVLISLCSPWCLTAAFAELLTDASPHCLIKNGHFSQHTMWRSNLSFDRHSARLFILSVRGEDIDIQISPALSSLNRCHSWQVVWTGTAGRTELKEQQETRGKCDNVQTKGMFYISLSSYPCCNSQWPSSNICLLRWAGICAIPSPWPVSHPRSLVWWASGPNSGNPRSSVTGRNTNLKPLRRAKSPC